jgi:hypothetical protein
MVVRFEVGRHVPDDARPSSTSEPGNRFEDQVEQANRMFMIISVTGER